MATKMPTAAAVRAPPRRPPRSSVAKTPTTRTRERTCLTISNRRRISPNVAPARSREATSRKTTGAAITTRTLPPTHTARAKRIASEGQSTHGQSTRRPAQPPCRTGGAKIGREMDAELAGALDDLILGRGVARGRHELTFRGRPVRAEFEERLLANDFA